MRTLWQDLAYGWRMLRKSPGVTVVVVMTLALGIGANTAIFSIFEAVLVRPLPVEEPERLVVMGWVAHPQVRDWSHWGWITRSVDFPGRQFGGSFSEQTYAALAKDNPVLANVFAFRTLGEVNVRAENIAEVVGGQVVSGGYYPGLRLRPGAGRLLGEEDDRAGADPAAVVSWGYAQRRFGTAANAVGKVIFVNRKPFTIAGVTPADFAGTNDTGKPPQVTVALAHAGVFFPQERERYSRGDFFWIGVMGRLKPGVTPEQATAALNPRFVETTREFTKNVRGAQGPELVMRPGAQGHAEFRRRNAHQFQIFYAVAGLVLLIACANVANMLLARSGAREREMAVRLALGAGRGRVIRQLMTESLLLAGIGGVAGLVVAYLGKGLLFEWLPLAAVPEVMALPLDYRVLAFAGVICAMTAVLFGVLPALQASRVNVAPALKSGGRGTTAGRGRLLLGKGLVSVQVALSLVVLVAAGLFVRTVVQIQKEKLGFNAANILLFDLDGSLAGYEGTRLANLYEQISERIAAMPGVRSVGTSEISFLSGMSSNSNIFVPGYTPPTGVRPMADIHRVSMDFFRTMELPLQLGRTFERKDDERSPRVAVVNEEFVRKYFRGENPLGRRFDFGESLERGGIEIVGVVGDAKSTNLKHEIQPTVFEPARQHLEGLRGVTFEVKTLRPPREFTQGVTRIVREVDVNLPVHDVKTQEEQVSNSLKQEKRFAWLSSFFGGVGLLLACVGLYGLLSHVMTLRTNEMGIRMALGAQRKDVFGIVVGQGMLLVGIGLAAGAAGAYFATRLIASQLYGVKTTDAVTYAVMAGLLALVALGACGVPARRMAKTDPSAALRYE